MRGRPGLSLLLIVMTALLAGCSPRSAAPPASPSPQPGVAVQPGATVQGVTVALRDFAIEPRAIKVKPGRVGFRITNRGAIEHDFHIPAVEKHRAHAQHLVKPGETRTLEYDLRPGTYEVVCTLPGHREAGMIAALEVAP
ncbi:MAG: hypothetical protein A2Z07_03165 [Armatimonadetes bacterium RBG_16_67_12]|nr:MAG: hypothetical protein A2Z07_03165 [Armatimonadetes bacterium RBG_16_67_12]